MTELYYHKQYIDKYYNGKKFHVVKPYDVNDDISKTLCTTATTTTTTTATIATTTMVTTTTTTSGTRTARMSTGGRRRRRVQTVGIINNPIIIDYI